MALTAGFFNSVNGDRKYNAESISKYFSGIISRGVLQNYMEKFQVTAGASNEMLTVQVRTGKAYFSTGEWVENTSVVKLQLLAASTSLPRIDRIVLRRDKNESERNVKIAIKTGTPATDPQPPIVSKNDYIEELSLAQIRVAANQTVINQSHIYDERGIDSVCGYVHQLVDNLDTTDLFTQYDYAFNQWFDGLRETVATQTMIRQYTFQFVSTANDTTEIPIGITQYNQYLDILNVFINGLKLVQDVEYIVMTGGQKIKLMNGISAGQTVEFEVLKSVDGSDAETIVDSVANLETQVNELIQNHKFDYHCNGVNDNVTLHNLCVEYFNGTGTYGGLTDLKINVIGNFVCSSLVYDYDGDATMNYSFAADNTDFPNKNLVLNFANAQVTARGAFGHFAGVTVENLTVRHTNKTIDNGVYSIYGENSTFRDCNVIGQYNGGDCIAFKLVDSTAINCKTNIFSAGGIYGIDATDSMLDNCNVYVRSTAVSAYGVSLTGDARANNCVFTGVTDASATTASGNGGIGGGTFANCIFRGFGALKGHGFYLRTGYLANMSNCTLRGYTKNTSSGLGVGFITASGDANTIILHGINCNQVNETYYSQTAAMQIQGGHGVYDGCFYTAPTIYDANNVVSHGSYNRNRV